MTTLREAADEFLDQHRIAVAGVSRDEKQPANLIYRRLRDTGDRILRQAVGRSPGIEPVLHRRGGQKTRRYRNQGENEPHQRNSRSLFD